MKEKMHWELLVFCRENNLELVTEYQFHVKRRWRYDFAIPAIKTAIEYEGVFSTKSRHTSVMGYTGDTEKYNSAVKLGWKVLRYTAKNSGNMLTDLKELYEEMQKVS